MLQYMIWSDMDSGWIDEVIYPILTDGFEKINGESQEIKYAVKNGRQGAMLITVDGLDEFEVYKISIERLI